MKALCHLGLCWTLVLLGASATAQTTLPRTPAPTDAKVYIISPKPKEKVKSPFIVRFGLSKMGVAPAGVNSNNTGHHHLLIDTQWTDSTKPIPNDDKHRHFGGGQTETLLELPPGKHTLQLVLGDHLHIPHDPPVQSEVIEITVIR